MSAGAAVSPDLRSTGALLPQTALGGWWYARLYTGGMAAGDEAVDQVVAPFARTVAGPDVGWFFLRYTDLSGPHLRVRVRGSREVLDRCHRRLPELCAQLQEVCGTPRPAPPTLVAVDTRPFGGRHVGADTALYEPEAAKYGGAHGVELAEALFQTSSEIALLANTLPKLPDRAGLAVLLLRAGLAGTLRAVPDATAAALPARFWDTHLMWWTADPGGGDASRLAVLSAAAADRHGISVAAERLAGSSADAVARWADAVAGYQVRASAAGVTRSPAHLLFHHNHMMLNRLGVLPREEAVLGRLAGVRT